MDIIEKISILKWGTQKQEYRNIFSDKQWLPDHPTENAVGFLDTVENKKVTVVAYFLTDHQDSLAKIILACKDFQTDTQRKYIFEDIIKDLSHKYGEPKSSTTMARLNAPPEYRISESIIWKTDDTVIDASLSLLKHGTQNPGIGIVFFDRNNDPLMKEFPDYGNYNNQPASVTGDNFKPLSKEQLNQTQKVIDKKNKIARLNNLLSQINNLSLHRTTACMRFGI